MNNPTPTATDALRSWLIRAGYSIRRRDAALAALDAFDAALAGEDPAEAHTSCRWSESRQRWEQEIRPGVSKEACGHAHVAGTLATGGDA